MLEIIAVIGLARRVGEIVEAKGYKSGWFKAMVVGFWIVGEIIGALIGIALVGGIGEGLNCVVYIVALAGAAAGGGLAYWIASAVNPIGPPLNPPEADVISDEALPQPGAEAPQGPEGAVPADIGETASGTAPAADRASAASTGASATSVSAPASSAPQPRTNTLAIVSLVLGILSLLGLACYGIGVVLGIVALVLGIVALGQIKRQGVAEKGRGLAIAGIVTGSLGILVGLLAFVTIIGMATAGDDINKLFERIIEDMESALPGPPVI